MSTAIASLPLPEQHFVSDLEMTRTEVESITDRAEEATTFSTPALVDSYLHTKAAVKGLTTTSDALRKELLTRMNEGVEDTKGAIKLSGAEGAVEFRPRQSAKMDAAAMEVLLKSTGFFHEATDIVYDIPHPENVYKLLLNVVKELKSIGQNDMAGDLEVAANAIIQVKQVINEKKVEKLAKPGKNGLTLLDPNQAAACYTVSTTYALYDAA